MVWRVSPAHKKLQTRMEQMRKFRRQHEQLRTVIVRVLRPTVIKTTTLADGDTADLKPEMDAADLNAIEEVCLVSFLLQLCQSCFYINLKKAIVMNDIKKPSGFHYIL